MRHFRLALPGRRVRVAVSHPRVGWTRLRLPRAHWRGRRPPGNRSTPVDNVHGGKGAIRREADLETHITLGAGSQGHLLASTVNEFLSTDRITRSSMVDALRCCLAHRFTTMVRQAGSQIARVAAASQLRLAFYQRMESEALCGTGIHPFAKRVGVAHRFTALQVVGPSVVKCATDAGAMVAGGGVRVGEPPALA